MRNEVINQQVKLEPGMRMWSTDLECYHILVTVTDKKLSYRPEIERGGLVVNKNRIRVFTTSLKRAIGWVNAGSWVIQKS